MPNALRQDRDRFVAYAFAAADLLIELGANGLIQEARGAVQTVCGYEPNGVIGATLPDLVAEEDRRIVRRALTTLGNSGRLDPTALRILHKSGRRLHVLLGGCALPTVPGSVFVTMTLIPPLAAASAEALVRDTTTGLLDKDTLLDVALGKGATMGQKMTLVRLDGLSSAVGTLPQERGRVLMSDIGAALRARSAGGDAAGRLGEEEFGIIPGKNDGEDSAEAIRAEIAEAARSAGVIDGLIKTRFGSIDLSPGTLNDRDAARALAYAVKRFSQARGDDFTLTSLQDEFTAEIEGTLSRYGDLQELIDEGRFTLSFQPIVRIADRALHHYEALSRFPNGQSPYEVITFGEGVGLVEPLDLAVCRKALAALEATNESVVAVNISGRSIQNEQFRTKLSALLAPKRHLHNRLIF